MQQKSANMQMKTKFSYPYWKMNQKTLFRLSIKNVNNTLYFDSDKLITQNP